MADFYFALGTTLAGQTNLEATVTLPPHALEGGRIPFVGPLRRQTLDRAIQRNGSITVPMRWDLLRLTHLKTLITTYWTSYTTASAALFATWLAEDGRWYPYAVTLERPVEGEHYQVANPIWARQLLIPGYGWTRQVNTENSSTTLTTSERYTQSNTTAGAVVLTLPAASAVSADTLMIAEKTGGANALSFARAGTDTIDGNTSLTITTYAAIASNGVNAWTQVL